MNAIHWMTLCTSLIPVSRCADFYIGKFTLKKQATRQWSRSLPPGLKPAGRYGHTLNILGSKIYVFGGQVDTHFFNDLIAFDLNALQVPSNQWELLIPDSVNGGPPEGATPPGRTNHTIVTYNDKLYLWVYLHHLRLSRTNNDTDSVARMVSNGLMMSGRMIRV